MYRGTFIDSMGRKVGRLVSKMTTQRKNKYLTGLIFKIGPVFS